MRKLQPGGLLVVISRKTLKDDNKVVPYFLKANGSCVTLFVFQVNILKEKHMWKKQIWKKMVNKLHLNSIRVWKRSKVLKRFMVKKCCSFEPQEPPSDWGPNRKRGCMEPIHSSSKNNLWFLMCQVLWRVKSRRCNREQYGWVPCPRGIYGPGGFGGYRRDSNNKLVGHHLWIPK